MTLALFKILGLLPAELEEFFILPFVGLEQDLGSKDEAYEPLRNSSYVKLEIVALAETISNEFEFLLYTILIKVLIPG